MAERIPVPATAVNIEWNTNPTNPSTDPTSQRAAGWAVDEIPDAQEFNYIWTMQGDFMAWLKQFAPREWTELSEGITDASVFRQLFRVCPPNATMLGRLGEIFSTAGTAATGGNVTHICTDGQRVYYISGATLDAIIGASPVDLTEEWEFINTATTQVVSITCDGRFVYFVSDATEAGLWTIGLDGAGPLNAGATYGHSALRANGTNCVGISGNTGVGDLDIWASSPISLVATKSTGSPGSGLLAVAIDDTHAYVAGTRNAPNDIWAYPLTGGAATWSVPLDTNDPSPVNGICTDGDFLYVVTDSFAIAAGGNRGLFCLDKVTGTVLWTFDLGADLVDCAVDSDYLYVVDSSNILYMFKLHSPEVGLIATKTNVSSAVQSLAADGVNVFCRDASATTNVRRLTTSGPTKTFMRVSGQDTRRRPFFTLAVPVGR